MRRRHKKKEQHEAQAATSIEQQVEGSGDGSTPPATTVEENAPVDSREGDRNFPPTPRDRIFLFRPRMPLSLFSS